MKVNVFWFRRDLRLEDNRGLFEALRSGLPVIPIFIFDTDILDDLTRDDARVTFIYDQIKVLHNRLGGRLQVEIGRPAEIWTDLVKKFEINEVFTNHDYEPYANRRDSEVWEILGGARVRFSTFKDQVIFEKSEVVKDDRLPYTVFTPYKKKWLAKFDDIDARSFPSGKLLQNVHEQTFELPDWEAVGFSRSDIRVKPLNPEVISNYQNTRDIPSLNGTSYAGPHLRFGTVSVRQMVSQALRENETYLSELIWREFFMQILHHFPHVMTGSFRPSYDRIRWENNEVHFKKWCRGETGYPMVDAGMRELNATGYMHNRVRMVVASFLTKHLLIDWRWGEAYFAEKLLDYELASNNGNWQWAAGTGCDAAPYFRVFNPIEQQRKFDPQQLYIKKWLGPDLGKSMPIVDHKFARIRAIERYKEGLAG